MTESSRTILAQLPARLRAARRERGLSLDAVAKLSGVSRSMVSQIERGESSPTVSTLWNLTRALQVDFAGLLDEAATDDRLTILRADEVPTIDNRGAGCRIRILSPPEEAGRNEVYELALEAGSLLDSAGHARGTREHLTVISGELRVSSGAHAGQLGPGDTARYAADVPHRIEAPSGAARAFLLVQAD